MHQNKTQNTCQIYFSHDMFSVILCSYRDDIPDVQVVVFISLFTPLKIQVMSPHTIGWAGTSGSADWMLLHGL